MCLGGLDLMRSGERNGTTMTLSRSVIATPQSLFGSALALFMLCMNPFYDFIPHRRPVVGPIPRRRKTWSFGCMCFVPYTESKDLAGMPAGFHLDPRCGGCYVF